MPRISNLIGQKDIDMTPRERVEAVYAGQVPDQVPLLLDLSHYYKCTRNKPFNLAGYTQVEQELVELHKQLQAVCYVEMGSFYELRSTRDDIISRSDTKDGVFYTYVKTPEGSVHEERTFSVSSYSYNIKKHLLESVDDFPVIISLMEHVECIPRWDRWHAWNDALGDVGYPYCQLPYSGLGYLISRNYGVEKTIYTHLDYPDETKALVDAINKRNLEILDTIIDGPFSTLIISDNYDSNIQTKELFDCYSKAYYTEVAQRLHKKGKHLAVHVDGEMRGALRWMAECDVDCIDAATPSPMFSLSPQEARKQAGNAMILSGGIPATVFGVQGTDEEFIRAVKTWLATKETSPRLFMAAGDQVPTDAPFHRIEMLPTLVREYGSY
ncbi:MAG: hypothetical protein M0P29_10525 [Sphaerochaetaceae bacterium]|nr:hypothetical protein [Sphaerochaetaceae bacterium]